ncbi:hypothetical protein PHYPSEUDO_001889 [Phytophthora pseudosyringae]|uniref:Uncharacterized protein n=1 Tax=Phytophthora pseudosyringae TaxID=221518 RepID=A0A8T1WFL4_9STRA|nr:hypothetical protein PHYPSEUDO_001889 [Phytophthora pseudosyringae]
MDVILAQLGPRELESHCRDAMKTQLDAMHRALNDTVDAAKRVEEVQLASQKLAITLFEDGSELSSTLLVSTWMRDELVQSLERVMARALSNSVEGFRAVPAKSVPRASSFNPQNTDSAPQKKRKTPEAAKKPKSTNALTKALAVCANLTEELAKKKKVVDRVPGLKALVQHFNTTQRKLDRNSIVDQAEALDTLSVVAGMAVSIMQHGKPQMKRHWVQKFCDNIADIKEQFPDSAAAFNGYINSLSKIISGFPLTIKEGQQLRMRLRKALEEVKGWKDGEFTIGDATQNISLVAEALESTCPNWTPHTDKTIRDLTALLLNRVSLFKDNKKQAKRKQKLQSWLADIDECHQKISATARSPSASDASATAKNASKSLERKQTAPVKTSGEATPSNTHRKGPPLLLQNQDHQPRLSSTAPSDVLSSSTESSDTEPTQRESGIKIELLHRANVVACILPKKSSRANNALCNEHLVRFFTTVSSASSTVPDTAPIRDVGQNVCHGALLVVLLGFVVAH